MTRSIAATSFISRGWKVYCSFCSKIDILILIQIQLLATKGDANLWQLTPILATINATTGAARYVAKLLRRSHTKIWKIWKKLLVGVLSSHWSSLTCQESISALRFFGISCRFPKMMASIYCFNNDAWNLCALFASVCLK